MFNFIEKFVNALGTPCQLHCRPKKKYFSLMLKDVVTDGTPCRPGTRDMCIHGICTVSCSLEMQLKLYRPLTVKKLKLKNVFILEQVYCEIKFLKCNILLHLLFN